MSETEPFINPIDPDKVAQNPGLLPYAHTLSSGVIRPDDTGKIKSNALLAMEQQTNIQLKQLQDQIQVLYNQAQEIKARTEISIWIYQAHIRFDPLINHVYHLYQNEDETFMLSMVAPGEWGRTSKARAFIATVRLLADHTWEILKRPENQA